MIAAAQTRSIPGDVAANVERHLVFARRASAHGARLLVFPELSLTGYELALAPNHILGEDSPELLPLRDHAQEHGLTLVAGAPVASPAGLHIGALVFHADGTVSRHTKQYVHSSEQPPFTAGSGGYPFTAGSLRVALAICRDATFAEHAADAAASGATLYAASAMITPDAIERKAGLLREYARRHRMMVLLANYSGCTGGEESAGRSSIWSPEGAVIAASPGAEESLVMALGENGSWHGQVDRFSPAGAGLIRAGDAG